MASITCQLSGTTTDLIHDPEPVGSTRKSAAPTRVVIPGIGVDAPIAVLGVEPDESLSAPPLEIPNLAGWYGSGPSPGEVGSAVIAGHLDTQAGPAVFARLHELKPGDLIQVFHADGNLTLFMVDRIEQVPKSSFPAALVYGSTNERRLRLITCGGVFDPAKHSYRDNVIVHTLYQGSDRKPAVSVAIPGR